PALHVQPEDHGACRRRRPREARADRQEVARERGWESPAARTFIEALLAQPQGMHGVWKLHRPKLCLINLEPAKNGSYVDLADL
ncbi:MAG: hypothetical protein WED01_09420, partial [Candidatus Rokuibacteriota bacterium]